MRKIVAYLLMTGSLLVSCKHDSKFSGNPILPDFHADPSAHVFDGTLWLYPSHDIAGTKYWWKMFDWHAFSSNDLVHWKDHGVIFSLKETTWAKRYAWAPDAMQRNGKYYFYFCASDIPGNDNSCANCIGIAVSDRPEGPFKDALGKPLVKSSPTEKPAMDPCIFIDDDQQAYLYYGQIDLRVLKLKEDMVTIDGEIKHVDIKNFGEGIWIHKYKGKYYLSYPMFENNKASRLAYSMGDSPYGPFQFKGVIIDNHSRNIHHSIVQYKGQWYLFYHVQGPSAYERRVCAEFLEYNDDGTIKPIKMTKTGIRLKQ